MRINVFKRNLLTILFLTNIFSISTFSQCPLTFEKIPTFHGLKLGMTSQAVAGYLKIEQPLKNKLTVPSLINPNKKTDVGEKIVTLKSFQHASLKGVSRLQLTFFKNSLYDIELDYSKTYTKWETNSEFTDYISEKLSLPRDDWKNLQVISNLQCRDFTISVNIMDYAPFGSTISLTNTLVVTEIIMLAKQKLKNRN